MGTQKHRNLLLLLVLILVSPVFSKVSGQESNTLYFMKGVPQSYQLNPAIQPGCRFFLGLPAASPFQAYFESSAFALKDVIFPLGDSLVTFLHPSADKNEFLDNLAPVNTIQAYGNINLLSVGNLMDNEYYTFDLSEKFYARFTFNDDLLDFLLTGNKRGDRFNFSNTNIDFTSYIEFATGNSRNISDRLRIGSRVKLLFGEVNISTNNKELSLATDEDWTIRSNVDIRSSIPGWNIDSIDIQFNPFENSMNSTNNNNETTTINPVDVIRSAFSNIGLGLDLGLQYALTDKIMLSGSLLDLAGIRWSASTSNIRLNSSYVYRGIEIDPTDTTGATKNFFDSLSTVFSPTTDSDPYYTMLPVKLYLGGTYQVIDQIGFGVLSRTEYYKKRLREQVTLSANFSPLKILTVSLSYTLFNHSYSNFGFGFSARFGPFNMYLVSDNIPTTYAVDASSSMILPYDSRILNLRIGFNLAFGCTKERKKSGDLPLVY
jgi:hypothetical protein